jgi:hypothetical protein
MKAIITLTSVSSPAGGQWDAVFKVKTPGCKTSACGHFEGTFVMGDNTTEMLNIEGWHSEESSDEPFEIKRSGHVGGAATVTDITDIEQAEFTCED